MNLQRQTHNACPLLKSLPENSKKTWIADYLGYAWPPCLFTCLCDSSTGQPPCQQILREDFIVKTRPKSRFLHRGRIKKAAAGGISGYFLYAASRCIRLFTIALSHTNKEFQSNELNKYTFTITSWKDTQICSQPSAGVLFLFTGKL